MAKYRSIRNSFLGGQISPLVSGRTDLPQYAHSCEILQNFIPVLSGGVYRRPGTIYADALLQSGGEHPPKLLPFVISKTEAYAILLGSTVSGAGASGYAKSYRVNGNGTVTSSSITGNLPYFQAISLSNMTDDEIFDVQSAQSADEMWLVHPNRKPQLLKYTAVDTFSIGDFDAGLTGQALMNAYPFLNQNTTTTTITPSAMTGAITLTASAALFDPNHVGTIFAIDHGSGVVGCAQITGYTSSTVVNATVIVDFSAATEKAEWWESAWSNYRGWPRSVCIFEQRLCMAGTTHQPDSIWFSHTANFESFSMLNQNNPGATLVIQGSIPASPADTSNGGGQITVAAGTINFPVDDSEGDGRTTGPTGTQPFRITLSQTQLDQIQWLSPDKELLVGTLGEEWIIAAINGSFDVANSTATIQSHYGSDYIPAVRIGYELMFVLGSKDEARAYQYNFLDASFFGEPVQLLFGEYPKPETSTAYPGRKKFRGMEWDSSRNTLWCQDTAGNFFGMTRDRKLQITAWHTHQFGGFDSTKGVGNNRQYSTVPPKYYFDPAWLMCDGSVVSFTVVPNPQSGINDIWLVIKRTQGGAPIWFVERMVGKNTVRDSAYSTINPGNSSNYPVSEPAYVDCATLFSDAGTGAANLTYTVPTALNGYTLSGTYYSLNWGLFALTTQGAVSAGSTTLQASLPPDYGANTTFHSFVLGLPYTSIVQTARIDSGSVIGTAQAAIKRIVRAYVRLYKSLSGKVGSPPNGEDESGLEKITYTPSVQMAQSPEIYTGDKRVAVPSTYDRNGYLYVIQDQPLPFTIASLVMEGEEFD